MVQGVYRRGAGARGPGSLPCTSPHLGRSCRCRCNGPGIYQKNRRSLKDPCGLEDRRAPTDATPTVSPPSIVHFQVPRPSRGHFSSSALCLRRSPGLDGSVLIDTRTNIWLCKDMLPFLQPRIWTFISLIIIVPTGFASKFYQGPASAWVNDSLGGVFYEIFWCLVIFFISPRARPLIIGISVLFGTCILEFMQLWHPPFLEFLRSYFIGRTVLGTTFVWSDFPYYFIGSGIGWRWLSMLQKMKIP